MKRFISFLLCLVLLLSCFSCCFTTVWAANSTAVMYNGCNDAIDLSNSGILSLCGTGTKTLDANEKAEGSGSIFIDMPSASDEFLSPFAYFTDFESATYYTLADYDYLEILYKSSAQISGDYKVQIRLVDKAVSVAGGGYEYEVPAVLDQKWNKAVFDLSAPYYTLEGMQGKFDRIRFVMINNSGSYKEIDTHIDGILLYTEDYKNQRDNALALVEQKISALPQPTTANATEVKTQLDDIAAALTNGVATYQNFVPSNMNEYAAKKALSSQLASGIDPTQTKTLLYNGFDSQADANILGPLSLAGNSQMYLDTDVKYSGNSSLRVDMADTNGDYIHPFTYYFDIDRDYIDYTQYDYVEAMVKTDASHSAGYHLQFHLIDTAVSIAGSGYDYDSEVVLDGNWRRVSQPLSQPYYTLSGIGNNINRVRFIFLNQGNITYQPVDMNVDTVFFCNQAYADARTNAEQSVAELIGALPQVTQANYASLTNQFAEIDSAFAQGNQNFVNFYPANYADYMTKKAMYNSYNNGGTCVTTTTAFAMPNFFLDNMMFQREKPMNLFGKATTGNTITANLFAGSNTTPIDTATAYANNNGQWTVSLGARNGDYTNYRIDILENGVLKRTLSNVLVGELWLATGQSNMEYRLDWEKDGAAEIAAANDPYLRVMLMTGNPVGTAGTPRVSPAFDIHGSVWIDGANQTYLGMVSANAYYACKQLREKLNMPVGFINASLGATNIQTWLSRESIEGNEFVKSSLQNSNTYLTEAQSATIPSDYRHMTAMYNTKIGPLAGMNLGGLLWCQGESNRDGAPNNKGFYCEAIQVLASSYSKIFGFEKGDMPVIVINIASHPYLEDAQNIPKWIEEIADAAKKNPNIVNIPIYDAPLTYVNPPSPDVAYPIHPNVKRPGGTRAGLAAFHNFCKEGNGDYYAPTVSSYEAKDGAIYVTFDNAVNGLTTLNNSIGVHGFTVAGDDGLFLPAKAEIQGKNIVKIWNDSIKEPINFTYAFNSHAQTANLCNSYNLPAIPFRSNRDMTRYFGSNDWMYCEDTTVFENRNLNGEFKVIWQPSGPATLAIDTATRYEGTGSICLNYNLSGTGTVAAVSTFGYYLMPFHLGDYQTISVMVKNPDSRAKTLQFLVGKAGTNDLWSLPSATTPGVYEVTVPANSDFTRYAFAVANAQGVTTNETLNLADVNRIDLLVGDTSSGKVYIDDITVGSSPVDLAPFTAYTENLTPIYHVGLTAADASDPTWKDYNYIGQEFVPATDTLYGVKLPLHFTSGKATLHMEIRSTINGTAIASTDVELTGKGNQMEWYDIAFQEAVTLKPFRTYYFVYYLTSRDADSICISYGRDLGEFGALYLGYAWPMATGGTPVLTSLRNQLQFGFQLLTQPLSPSQEEKDKAAAKAVIDLIAALKVEALEDEAAVTAARTAYNGLTETQKPYVTNLDALVAAEQAVNALKQAQLDKAVAQTVINLINTLPETVTSEDASLVSAVRSAYDGLTETQKTYVTNVEKLLAAEEQLKTEPPVKIPFGDVNGDGKIDAKDALEVLKYAVDKVQFTEQQSLVAEVTGDGDINAKDALEILKYSVNKITQFPIETRK